MTREAVKQLAYILGDLNSRIGLLEATGEGGDWKEKDGCQRNIEDLQRQMESDVQPAGGKA